MSFFLLLLLKCKVKGAIITLQKLRRNKGFTYGETCRHISAIYNAFYNAFYNALMPDMNTSHTIKTPESH